MLRHTKNNQFNKPPPNWEYELVLAAISLRNSRDTWIHEIIQHLRDWSLIFQIASQHGVFPLFYKRILSYIENYLPQSENARWKELVEINSSTNIRLAWKLTQCVELLSNNRIENIVLKGPVTAVQAYGELTLRPYTDLDILIHQQDFHKLYDLLVQSGYTPAIDLTGKQKKIQVWSDNHFTFNRQGDAIEIHWEIAPRECIHPLKIDYFWQDLNSVQILGQKINCLSPQNTILFTCLHGAKHCWNQLKWTVDLAFMCQSLSEKFWLTLLEDTQRLGFFRQICLGLVLVKDLVGYVFPPQITDILNTDRSTKLLAIKVKKNLDPRFQQTPQLNEYIFFLKSRDRWQDQLIYILGLLIIPQQPDLNLISLPIYFYFLYYIFRPIRLLFKYLKVTLLKLL